MPALADMVSPASLRLLQEAKHHFEWQPFAEAKYNAEQLKALGAKGQAVKNPQGEWSYPIADEQDLRNAIRAVGRGSGSHDQIRKYIKGRAKALGKSDLIPDNWSASGAMKEAAVSQTELAVQTSLTEAVRGTPTGRRMEIQLITPGWGASGYYSEATLKQAAKDKIFPAGTQMYIDHQTLSEQADRVHGERSLKDLAARFITDARWDGKALVAQVEVTNPLHRPVLSEMADHVGVSIRALGEAEQGEQAGREGLIVNKIVKAVSVDFVAEAGRGGRVLALLESARELSEARNIGAWFEARLHTMFTEIADGMYGDGRLTREERIGLSSGIGDALGAFVQRVEADQPQLYKRDIYTSPDAETAVEESSDGGETPAADEQPAPETETVTPEPETGETEAAESADQDVPADQAAQATTTPLEEGDPDMGQENTSPGSARQLMERQLAEANRRAALVEAREQGRRILAEALSDAWIPPATVTRITESLIERLPIANGVLDETELVKMAGREAERAEREMAEALEAAGMGRPRDLGFGTDAGNQAMGLGQAELDRRLEESFKGLGLTDKQAAVAARGRD